jgi:hypothetical protein
MTEDGQIVRIEALMDAETAALETAMNQVFGELPDWIPLPSRERAARTIRTLIADGFGGNAIAQSVTEAAHNPDEMLIPGTVRDSLAFIQAIHELAHLRYAVSRGKLAGLRVLAGEQAEHGQRFKEGRKNGTSGPIRKAIARLLAKTPTMKNPELWSAIKKNPPRGWQAFDSPRLGKYLESGPQQSMTYKTFCNICAEERNGPKIPE